MEAPWQHTDGRKNGSNSAGKNSALEQGRNVPQNWKPTATKPLPSTRCTGTVRNGEREGEQCGSWAPPGSTVCQQHGYQLPVVREAAEKRVEAARQKMLGLTPDAMDVIEQIMLNGTQEAVRLKAATEILDRAGITKGPVEHKVEVNHSISQAEEIEKRIAGIAKRLKAPELEDLGEEDEENIIDEPIDAE